MAEIDHEALVLEQIRATLGRIREAKRLLKDGLTVPGRGGAVTIHPAARYETAQRGLLLRLLRSLPRPASSEAEAFEREIGRLMGEESA